MRLTIESTDTLTHFGDVPCRVWKAKTESGIECVAFVHRLAVKNEADASEFAKDLIEHLPPGKELPLAAVLDGRMF